MLEKHTIHFKNGFSYNTVLIFKAVNTPLKNFFDSLQTLSLRVLTSMLKLHFFQFSSGHMIYFEQLGNIMKQLKILRAMMLTKRNDNYKKKCYQIMSRWMKFWTQLLTQEFKFYILKLSYQNKNHNMKEILLSKAFLKKQQDETC